MGLFGGLLGFAGGLLNNSSQRKMHAQDTYNNTPQGIRANAEAAGFNPLVFAGPGVGTGAGYTPQLSNPLANLGEGIDAHFSEKEALKLQRSELELEKRRLDEIVKRSTLAPPVPGIYGGLNGRENPSVSSDRTASRGDDLRAFGTAVKTDDRFSDADAMEQRYGDVASSIYGLTVAGADILKTFGIKPPADQDDDLEGMFFVHPDREKRPKTRPKSRPKPRPSKQEIKEFMRGSYPTAFD